MLHAIENGTTRQITQVPHLVEFGRWMSRLSAMDYQRVREALQRRIDGGTIHTSSWIPGSDWRGTVFEPLYEACNRDVIAAGQFFGIILWVLLMEDDNDWSFGNYERDGVPIQGKTYFRIQLRLLTISG